MCSRFRSPGSCDNRIHPRDLIKGEMELPENDQDTVILKSDGIPTYHFAHVVDDHLMGTTHGPGREWLATWPIHLQLFEALGWRKPNYLHTAHMLKMDGASSASSLSARIRNSPWTTTPRAIRWKQCWNT